MKRTFRLAMLGVLSLAGAPAETLVLNHFTLIDGTGKPPLDDGCMVVTEGRIAWVGPSARLKARAGAQTVDAVGKFVMPGVIDLHSHRAASVGLVQDTRFYTRETVELQLAQYAAYGVTSVVHLGSDQDLIFTLREEQGKTRPCRHNEGAVRGGHAGGCAHGHRLPIPGKAWWRSPAGRHTSALSSRGSGRSSGSQQEPARQDPQYP